MIFFLLFWLWEVWGGSHKNVFTYICMYICIYVYMNVSTVSMCFPVCYGSYCAFIFLLDRAQKPHWGTKFKEKKLTKMYLIKKKKKITEKCKTISVQSRLYPTNSCSFVSLASGSLISSFHGIQAIRRRASCRWERPGESAGRRSSGDLCGRGRLLKLVLLVIE